MGVSFSFFFRQWFVIMFRWRFPAAGFVPALINLNYHYNHIIYDVKLFLKKRFTIKSNR